MIPGVVGPLEAQVEEVQDDDVFLNGTLSSPECGIALGLNATTTHVEEHYAKAINYTLMVTAISFLQVRLAFRSCQSDRCRPIWCQLHIAGVNMLYCTVGACR